jgi:hypothetical protein
MALTAEQIVTIRRQVGNSPDDAALNEAHDRLIGEDDPVAAVVLEILEIRLADLRRQPSSFSIPGEYSQSTDGNIRTLEAQIAALGGGGAGTTILAPPARPAR